MIFLEYFYICCKVNFLFYLSILNFKNLSY